MFSKLFPLALAALLALSLPAFGQARDIAIEIADGKARGTALTMPARGAPVLRLTQGDSVTLTFASDRPTALHLHGYGLETRAAPDAPAAMNLTARAAGRFALETHLADGRHATLLYIEVHPK